MPIIREEGLVQGVTVFRKPKPTETFGFPTPVKKVAAYCRVSTNYEIQESSLELQMSSYYNIIQEHSGWELAGIYADKGITGTKTTRRVEFNRMIEDARNGKIDVILAKSLSRFARNTVDALQYTRELKSIGVSVYFEKEKIDSSNITSEFMLTIFAAFAQEESHSISENTKRGIRNGFRLGHARYARMLGYSHNWEINKEQAEIVQRIFDMSLDGVSSNAIAIALNADGVKKPFGSGKWNGSNIAKMLQNEKYCGDVLMQKYYCDNFLEHTKVTNSNANIEMYYKKNHHAEIITKENYNLAKFSNALKPTKYSVSKTPYYGMLFCPTCGKPMVKIVIRGAKKCRAWTCPGSGNNGTIAERKTCKAYLLFDSVINNTFRTAVNGLSPNEKKNKNYGNDIRLLQEMLKTQKEGSYARIYALVDKMTIEKWNTLVIEWSMGWTGKYRLIETSQSDKMLPEFLEDCHVIANTRKGYRNWQAGALKHIVEEVEIDGTRIHMVTVPEYLRSKNPHKKKGRTLNKTDDIATEESEKRKDAERHVI